GDAVGLAELHSARLLLDDAGLDVGKRRQLRGQRQPCRSAADNQDIDLLGNRTLRPRGRISLRPVENLRVPRLKTIQVKLHDPSLPTGRAAPANLLRRSPPPLIERFCTGSGA